MSGLLDIITCDCLIMKKITLNSDATRSLKEMLTNRVKVLEFSEGVIMDFSFLLNILSTQHPLVMLISISGIFHCLNVFIQMGRPNW